ncbi:hypothetical protein Pd630_LPD13096 (plasmid) [Rhodococcus opacus PD630]|nr:hypothetical protein Pd630_LPD13096 [Rhodococcus opacus PD630]
MFRETVSISSRSRPRNMRACAASESSARTRGFMTRSTRSASPPRCARRTTAHNPRSAPARKGATACSTPTASCGTVGNLLISRAATSDIWRASSTEFTTHPCAPPRPRSTPHHHRGYRPRTNTDRPRIHRARNRTRSTEQELSSSRQSRHVHP